MSGSNWKVRLDTDVKNFLQALSTVDWSSATVKFVSVNTDNIVRCDDGDHTYRDLFTAIKCLEDKLITQYEERINSLTKSSLRLILPSKL